MDGERYGMTGRENLQTVQGRNIMLDILRVTATLVVFLFHSSLALGIDYGLFREVAEMGATFMSFFFLLSGYTLYYVYGGWGGIGGIKHFFIRRAVCIMPSYFAATVVAIILVGAHIEGTRCLEFIALIPIYGLAIQSTNLGFISLFP